jgi:hypothetical protein
MIERYFISKTSTAVHEAFSNAYSDKRVLHKTTTHQLVKTFWDKEKFVSGKHLSHDKTAEITTVPITHIESTATIEYGFNNSILPVVSSFCVKGTDERM